MLDLALVLAFVVYAISSGLRARRRASEGLEQYFLAGRSVAGWRATGGLRSVISTDVLQFSLAIAGTAAYAWIAADKAGGLAALPSTLAGVYGGERAGAMPSWLPPPGELLMPFLVVIGLQWLFQMNADGTGYLAQRSMACATDAGARRAGVLFAWLQIVLRSVLWLVIGTALLVLYPIAAADAAAPDPAAREITFVLGIADHLPPGISGLMLVGLLAALASTLDTHLNWGASYWSNDVYRRLVCETWLRREPGRRELVVVARLSNVLILAIALAITARLGSIQTAWFVSLLFGAGMGSVLVLRWLWERITLWSELAAMACSIVAAPILLVATDAEWVRLALMAAISTTAAVAAALLGPPNDPAVTASFYRRVRPAGWWGRAAAAHGEPPTAPRRRLGRQLAVTAAAAGSLFLALVGFGRLALPAMASWTLVPVVSLVGAAVLAPVWLRSLRDEDAAEVA